MSEVQVDDDVEIHLPISFTVKGTPVSLQSGNPNAKQEWKMTVLAAAQEIVPKYKWAVAEPLAILIYDFPAADVQGDVDNIVKLIIDAMCPSIILDDSQVARVVVQRFSQEQLNEIETRLGDFPELVAMALSLADPPFVFVHVTNEIYGDVK